MDEKTIERWAREDLWSERDAARLCCGLDPNGCNDDPEAVSTMHERIYRACLVGKLEAIDKPGADSADKLYSVAKYFRPASVVAWALEKKLRIPPALADAFHKAELSNKERASALKMIIGMAIRKYQYSPSDSKSQAINEIVADLELAGVPLSAPTIRKFLKEAAALLDRE